MATAAQTKVPGWFWLVAGLALLWEAMGVASYLAQAYGATEMSAAQRQLVESTPAWVTGAYAVAVFGGVVAAIMLLLRRRWAKPMFIISLIAAVLQFGWIFGVGGAMNLLGGSAAAFPIVILLAGAALIWFASHADRNGWLR